MMQQDHLPGIPPPPERQPRNPVWRSEIELVVKYFGDGRARDRQETRAEMARVMQRLDDQQARIVDLEHTTGTRDIDRVPQVTRLRR